MARHDTASQGPRYGRLGCDMVGSASTRSLAGGVCHDTIACIVTRARAWLARDGSRYNQLYRDRRAAWSLRRVTIQSLVS